MPCPRFKGKHMNVLDYLEEEVGYVRSSDMPETLVTANILSITKGVLECDVVEEEDDEDDPRSAVSYQVLEFEVQSGLWDEPVRFVMVSEDAENGEWIYASTLEDYMEDNFYGQDDLTTTYEVIDEETF